MENKDFLLDYKPVDVSKEVGLVWSIANSLRGAYTSDKYKEVIIPMVIIRRFECALEEKKDLVVAKFESNPNAPAAILNQISGYPFYNTSRFNLTNLLNDRLVVVNIGSNCKFIDNNGKEIDFDDISFYDTVQIYVKENNIDETQKENLNGVKVVLKNQYQK